MANIESVRDALGNGPCRRCINRHFRVNLQPKDCKYYRYEGKCSSCGAERNIIAGFTLSGRIKMLSKRAR